MTNNKDFVAYEYKNITVKRDSVTIYTDCLSNFGWELVDEHKHSYAPAQADTNHIPAIPETVEGLDLMVLKFKRDRRIENKLEINRLERKCEDALAAIDSLEKKNSAYTLGVSIGTGLIGTAFLGFAVYSFMSSNIVVGVLLAILGTAGWGIGFFANLKLGRRKSAQTEPMIQAQLDVVYATCEQAHALIA